MGIKLFLAAASALALAAPSNAYILVDQASPYGGHYVGGSDMGIFTTKLAAQAGGYQIGSVGNASAVSGASALLIVTRDNNFGVNKSLTSAEKANITSFLATGKNVVIIGEGNFWDEWNADILGFASGTTAVIGPVVSGNTSPVTANALTAGVGSILLQGVGTTSGGTALFGQNFATLWKPNLLTVLDFQVFQDFGAEPFRDNVATYLGTTPTAAVPEPSTWAMMIGGFALTGVALRRRRTVRVAWS